MLFQIFSLRIIRANIIWSNIENQRQNQKSLYRFFFFLNNCISIDRCATCPVLSLFHLPVGSKQKERDHTNQISRIWETEGLKLAGRCHKEAHQKQRKKTKIEERVASKVDDAKRQYEIVKKIVRNFVFRKKGKI